MSSCQTEIQFLVSLMLDHKLPGPVKDKIIVRIGEVEAQLATKPQAPQPMAPRPTFSVRTPEMNPPQTEIPPPAGLPRQIVKQEIQTGEGLRGPRKF